MFWTRLSIPFLAILLACGDEGDAAERSDKRKAVVCQAWNDARALKARPTWNGSVESCNPGGDPGILDATVELANAYRHLAGLPPVVGNSGLHGMAQHCALAMHANRAISHDPPVDWQCVSAEGRTAAANSNVATIDGWRAVDLYMADFGEHNAPSLGHRRWLLSPVLQEVGVGSTDAFSCMWVVHPTGPGTRDFVAWPPPGLVPMEVVRGIETFYGSLDTIGWSIQSNSIDLGGATIRVKEDGVEKPGVTTELLPFYGSLYALKFNPTGWETKLGSTYAVTVEGADTPIAYEFVMVDCAEGS